MKTTIIIASVFAAFAAASPLNGIQSTSVQSPRADITPSLPLPTPAPIDVPSEEPKFIFDPIEIDPVETVPIEIDPVETVPIEIAPVEARQASTVRVLLAFDRADTAVQANIPRNGQRISIRANFAGLGNPLLANRGNIVSGGGSCKVFKDAAAKQQVGVLRANGNSVSFGGNVNLQNGVIVCN